MRSFVKSCMLGAGCLLSISTFSTAQAEEESSFYFRAGVTSLMPTTDSSSVSFDVSDVQTELETGVGSIAVGLSETGIGAAISGPETSASDSTFPSVRLGYRFAKFPNFSVETILASSHDVTVTFDESFDFAWLDIPDVEGDFAELSTLTPTASVLYSFDVNPKIKPYVGAGLAFIVFSDAKVISETLLAESGGNPEMELSSAMGVVLQAGVEYNFYKNWWLSADFRQVAGAETDVTISDLDIDVEADFVVPLLGTPGTTTATVDNAKTTISIDTTVLSFGVGLDF